MTPHATLKWFGITAFVLAVAGSATAQPQDVPTPLPFQRQVTLSPQEELKESQKAVDSMVQHGVTVQKQLATARTARDVVKTLCLNDKLSQVNAATRAAQDRLAAQQAAVARGDIEGAHHHFNILTAQKQNADQSTAQANQCVGSEIAFVGQTQVTTEVDETLPDVDVNELTDPVVVAGPSVPVTTFH